MKNLFFTLAFILVGAFTFANTAVTSEIIDDVTKIEKVQNQNSFDSSIKIQFLEDLSFTSAVEVENFPNDEYPCRWRVCTYRNGILVGCTDWTYGECLDEVVITAQK